MFRLGVFIVLTEFLLHTRSRLTRLYPEHIRFRIRMIFLEKLKTVSDFGGKVGHQDSMFVCFIPPYTPLLYSKTGVYRGIHFFFLFLL